MLKKLLQILRDSALSLGDCLCSWFHNLVFQLKYDLLDRCQYEDSFYTDLNYVNDVKEEDLELEEKPKKKKKKKSKK